MVLGNEIKLAVLLGPADELGPARGTFAGTSCSSFTVRGRVVPAICVGDACTDDVEACLDIGRAVLCVSVEQDRLVSDGDGAIDRLGRRTEVVLVAACAVAFARSSLANAFAFAFCDFDIFTGPAANRSYLSSLAVEGGAGDATFFAADVLGPADALAVLGEFCGLTEGGAGR